MLNLVKCLNEMDKNFRFYERFLIIKLNKNLKVFQYRGDDKN